MGPLSKGRGNSAKNDNLTKGTSSLVNHYIADYEAHFKKIIRIQAIWRGHKARQAIPNLAEAKGVSLFSILSKA